MERFAAYTRKYKQGRVQWLPPGTEDEDANSRFGGERVLAWHGPPLLPRADEEYTEALRALATKYDHPRMQLIGRKGTAYNLWIHQQVDSHSEQHRFLHPLAPCTHCGLFTAVWCDGVPATATTWGGRCQMPICSVCRRLFHECSLCVRHTGVAKNIDPRIRLPFPRGLQPNEEVCRELRGECDDTPEWSRSMAATIRLAQARWRAGHAHGQ